MTNYNQDRKATFQHNNIHNDLLPQGIPNASDYVQAEKAKQLSKLRDWYLDSHDTAEQTDLVLLRSNMSTVRDFESRKAFEHEPEIKLNPLYLLCSVPVGLLIAAILFIKH